jgi:hypothetical protein
MISRVTISGADDRVDPNSLLALTHAFPFVEWGILYSEKRHGTPRYPSQEWIDSLPEMRTSLHLCGASARGTLNGRDDYLMLQVNRAGVTGRVPFQRVQVNGYAPPALGLVAIAPRWIRFFEFILQVREEALLEIAAQDVRAIQAGGGRASILLDASAGRGIEAVYPTSWPARDVSMGFAGGIRPSTVESLIKSVRHDHVTWIDMESGVRDDNDRFDLALVRDVLERCKPYVRTP